MNRSREVIFVIDPVKLGVRIWLKYNIVFGNIFFG
jgi:hypothetical protein